MSKLEDEEILALQTAVETKRKRVQKQKARFAPETTCTYNGQNLHVKSVEGLVGVLADLIGRRNNHDEACEALCLDIDFKHQGFTYSQWESDIVFLVDKINLKKLESELSDEIEFLDNLVSKDTKDKKRFDSIKSKYGLA
jgi:hypothetical protein